MSQEFFKTLPLELIINILSRLPLRAITACKCVCKPWLDLLGTREFANSHLPNSVPALVFGPVESTYKIFELDDSLQLDRHDLHYNPLAEVRFPRGALKIQCSANGLLLLAPPGAQFKDPIVFYICNPITRDYIELQVFVHSSYTKLAAYGFGATKITGQLKVVRIIDRLLPRTSTISKSESHVYTVGTGSWRSIQPGTLLDRSSSSDRTGAFLNGNIHWMACDPEGSVRISCFDLETECFSTFSAPPVRRPPPHRPWPQSTFALRGCLCLCDNSLLDEIVIWSMKKYGDGKSWIKEFVVSKNRVVRGLFGSEYPNFGDRPYKIHPVAVFKDGDMLMAWDDFFLLYYCNKTKTTRKIDMFKPPSVDSHTQAFLHTPSFLSLKFFPMENVRSF